MNAWASQNCLAAENSDSVEAAARRATERGWFQTMIESVEQMQHYRDVVAIKSRTRAEPLVWQVRREGYPKT